HDGWTILNPEKYQRYLKNEATESRLIDFLIKKGYDRLYYGAPGRTVTFKSQGALICSDPYQENYLKYADMVDSSRKLAFLSHGEAEGFEANMKAIGGSYQKVRATDGYLLYTDFSPPQETYRMIPRHHWTGTSNLNPSEVKNAFDGDIVTGWGTKGPQKQGTTFLVDLGKVETIGKISYIPANYREVPVGYQVSFSLDGQNWQIVSKVPEYHGPIFWAGPNPLTKVRRGRVETVFPSHPCRFLKISLLQSSAGNPWSINELFLFGPDHETGNTKNRIPMESEIDRLLNFFKDQKIHFVYADPWLSALIRVRSDWKIQTVISNLFTGDNGENEPPAEAFTQTHLGRAVALVVTKEANDLDQLLLESKHTYRKKESGPFRIYYDFSSPARPAPLPNNNWEASANANPKEAGKAIDRNPVTRWTSGKPQEPGLYYQIDLKRVQTVKGCTLFSKKSINDYPRSLRLFSSLDGNSWEEIKTTAESGLYWTGETLLKMTGTRFFFSPLQLRYLKLLQDGQDPVYYWSIHELELF
ncbi:MAG: hypothetical protein C0407_10410, partial [Desulfobacca sp.]|nr:hypothetical protein [Desulfobacca sp.]